MTGIRIMNSDGKAVSHSVIWVDPGEVEEIFLLVKDGATALASPDYIADLLHQIDVGDLEQRLAWDHLLVKTPTMAYPEPCRVRRITGSGGAAEIIVGKKIVHKIT